jgi:hypothetical protein
MEAINVLPNGQYVNLQETFKEMDEDNERLLEEDILISNEEIGKENVLHVTDEDEEENQADMNLSDEDFGLVGNADDY